MSSSTMNTFSKKTAEDLTNIHNFKIMDIIQVEVDTFSNIGKKFIKGKNVDLLSIDVEGIDFEILKSIDFNEFFPTVICVETITFSTNGYGVKETGIIELLERKGYLKYADTYINTIFVRKDKWINH